MENPYSAPESKLVRVYKTPIIVPLSVIVIVALYIANAYLYDSAKEVGFYAFLKSISLEMFVLCQIVCASLVIYTKYQLESFLRLYPRINSRNSLEQLKPIVRTNMYLALVLFSVMPLGAFAGYMAVMNQDTLTKIVVVALSVGFMLIMQWTTPLEKRIKHIECTDDELEVELNRVLQCWMNKPFPEF